MRRILISALVVTVALGGLSTPAYADPVDDPQLTGNVLYTSGTIPRSSCAEKPISRPDHVPTAKAYLTFVAGCLDRVWSKQLAKAGVTYKKPKLSLLTRNPAQYCGRKWQWNWIYNYCEKNGTIVFALDRRILSQKPDDLYIFTSMAGLYGYHVQVLTGITKAVGAAAPGLDEASAKDLTRRGALQRLCLSGAFTGSVYKTMPRSMTDWKFVIWAKGREASSSLGTAKSIAYWMNRGFNSRDPKNCNTWTVANSQVA
ncbi:neutral zinc metallopeptidase [Herbidospora mongoliensis]|uniref:neutral zinc metallopeptidase n=1 Tax=Herbidospora mongoliensis TaxID=688067 RepID=UPI00082F81D0|nr:neutral zinc metallopeptidase [Herbidospora mongoliensis]